MLDLISAYGNDSANKFWEGNGVPSKLKPMSGMASSGSEITREARETFIRAKYESKEFCKYTHLDAEMQRGLASERSHLYGARLLSAVAMPGLSSTVELIAASTYRDVPVWWFDCSFFFHAALSRHRQGSILLLYSRSLIITATHRAMQALLISQNIRIQVLDAAHFMSQLRLVSDSKPNF